MFSHVMVGTNDMQKAKEFYDATLGALGYDPAVMDEKGRCFYMAKSGVFCITTPIDGEPACHANGGTIGFAVENPQAADAWHAAGLAHGGTACEDPPGIREGVNGQLYLAYLRDPDNNKVCTLHRIPSS
ncbi:MAG: VOC family protein [Proteobacteria bacterium]|nr:VOC family protein [Pseudomonadota bacterium]